MVVPRMPFLRRLGLILVATLWGGSVGSAHAASGDWYLALGDSLAAGVQSQPSVAGGGYATRLAVRLQTVDPGIQVENIAVPGETTTSFVGAQLAEAEAFLRANRGHVPFVTIDIGGNDVAGCGPGNPSCSAAGFAAIDRNVPMIVARLIASAGPQTRFAMMTYYDPFLEYWVTGSSGQTVAMQSLPMVDSLNAELVKDFGPRFVVADVAKAFSTDDMTDIVSTPNHGMVPQDVAVICRLTGGCDHGFDLHANSLGHQLIADTFFAAITSGVVPPVPPSAAEIKKSLSAELVPHGKAAKIAAILRAGGYTVSFKALGAGNAELNWYLVPPHAHLATGKTPKPLLVATGKSTFPNAGTSRLKIKLTPAGRQLLTHSDSMKLTARGSFTPTGKHAIVATKTFTLTR
jgi:lysophospholipase L1-like esterase